MQKNRSRILILSHIAQFCLAKQIGTEPYCGLRDHRFEEMKTPRIGSLVALSAAPASKWYLSWLVDYKKEANCFDNFLLESVEDGQLCWWSNVGICALAPQTVLEHPEWRWTDRQHAFYDRWKRVCYKENDVFMIVPLRPEFSQDSNKVTLKMRHRYSDDLAIEKSFPDWRKVYKRDMHDLCKEALKK